MCTEQDRYKRWIREAIEIRKRRGATMNRDEGQYQLTHIFDDLLFSASKNPAENKTGNTVVKKSPSDVTPSH